MRSPTAVAASLSVTDEWFGQSSVTPTTTPAVSRVQSDTLPGDITFPQPLAVSYQIVFLSSCLFVCFCGGGGALFQICAMCVLVSRYTRGVKGGGGGGGARKYLIPHMHMV